MNKLPNLVLVGQSAIEFLFDAQFALMLLPHWKNNTKTGMVEMIVMAIVKPVAKPIPPQYLLQNIRL